MAIKTEATLSSSWPKPDIRTFWLVVFSLVKFRVLLIVCGCMDWPGGGGNVHGWLTAQVVNSGHDDHDDDDGLIE